MTRNLCTAALAALVAGFLVAGCASEPPAEGGTTDTAASSSSTTETTPTTTEETPKEEEKPVEAKPLATEPKDGDEVAVFDTSMGKIVVMFHSDRAPKTVENFKTLAKKGFYNGTRFHRVIPGFMIQGGDPNSKDLTKASSWGTGGPGYMIDDELNDIRHVPGVLSMAHAGANTGGSQFFIMVGDAGHLDGVHTGFGQVVQGMGAVETIVKETGNAQDNGSVKPEKAVVVKSVKIEKWPVK